MDSGQRASRKGATLVESALAFNVLLFVLFGAMEFGQLGYAFNFVAYAAREGTRYASVRGQTSVHPAQASDVQNYVKAQAIALDSSKLTVTTTWNPNNNPGSTVTVNVTYSYSPMLNFVLHKSLTVGSTSKTVISQ